jgi:hypothetical protein
VSIKKSVLLQDALHVRGALDRIMPLWFDLLKPRGPVKRYCLGHRVQLHLVIPDPPRGRRSFHEFFPGQSTLTDHLPNRRIFFEQVHADLVSEIPQVKDLDPFFQLPLGWFFWIIDHAGEYSGIRDPLILLIQSQVAIFPQFF